MIDMAQPVWVYAIGVLGGAAALWFIPRYFGHEGLLYFMGGLLVALYVLMALG
jgi:hypothetical protein